MDFAEHFVEASAGRRPHVFERGVEDGLAVIGRRGRPGSPEILEWLRERL